jgi:vacuolar-type H+-ATPase subunit F/Vma7
VVIRLDIAVVGDRHITSVFRLAGVEAILAENDESAVDQVMKLAEEGACKVIIVTEKVSSKLKGLREELLKERQSYPIFIVIPDFEGPLGLRSAELQERVNRSVGAKLKAGE